MSNKETVSDSQARKEASAEFQLLLATLKVEDLSEMEQVAVSIYLASKSEKHRAALEVVTRALRAALDEMELCQLQVAAVSP